VKAADALITNTKGIKMAYTSGDLILDDHYNGFATNTNDVWGSGSGDYGYGQSNTISSVSAGSTVSATQWATLLSRITSAASHQGSSITSITSPSVGNTISAYTALSGNITTIRNNRRNYTANGSDSPSTATRSTGWFTDCIFTHTFSFGNTTQLRYFSNAGGRIRMSFGRSGGTSNSKNTEWTDLCSKAGTVSIDPNALTSSYVQKSKTLADTAPYTSNYIKTEAYHNGSGTVYVKCSFVDNSSDVYGDETWSYPTDITSYDRVDGSTTCTGIIRPPSTTYLTSSWGTPTVSSSVAGGIYDY